MENPAAVFTSQPQSVEIFRAGVWRAADLLGWRHDDSGGCQVRVRVAAGGIEESWWTELAALRLPERSLGTPVAAATVTAATVTAATVTAATVSSAGFSAPTVPSIAAPRRAAAGVGVGVADADTTTGLPLVRDHVGRSGAARPGGRRRAPEHAAAGVAAASTAAPSAPGRHRAPVASEDVAAGRHRAADTGLIPVIAGAPVVASDQEHPPTAEWAVPALRASLSLARTTPPGWTIPAGLEGDLLTRPLRPGDRIPRSRRPVLDGSFSRS